MQPTPSRGKHAAGVAAGIKRGKTFSRCQERENIQPVPRAGKHVTGIKSRKTSSRCQERENIQPVPSAGTDIKQPVPIAGKQALAKSRLISVFFSCKSVKEQIIRLFRVSAIVFNFSPFCFQECDVVNRVTCVDLDIFNQDGKEESVCLQCPLGTAGDGKECRSKRYSG